MYKNLVEVYVVNRDSHSRCLILGVIFGLIVGIMIANIVWSKKINVMMNETEVQYGKQKNEI